MVETTALPIMASFRSRDLATAMHCYGKMNIPPGRDMLAGLEAQAMACMDKYNAQDVSNTIWAYARLQTCPREKEMMSKLLRRANAISDFAPQGVANTLWGLAKLGVSPGDALMKGLERQAAARMGDFDPQNVANTLWAYATLGMRPGEEVMRGLERQAAARMGDFIPQAVANMLWGLAALDVCLEDSHVSFLCEMALHYLQLQHLPDPNHIQQFHLFLLWRKLHLAGLQKSENLDIVTALGSALGDAGKDALAASPISDTSRLQAGVAGIVKDLGHRYEEEAVDPRTGYSIDILIKPDGGDSLGTAVEVDGPHHFLSGERAANGPTLLKRRLLGHIGYRVVSVSYWEWDELNEEKEMKAFIQALLVSSRAWNQQPKNY